MHGGHPHDHSAHGHGHGHTHEKLDGPGIFHLREKPLNRNFNERAFTVGKLVGYSDPIESCEEKLRATSYEFRAARGEAAPRERIGLAARSSQLVASPQIS